MGIHGTNRSAVHLGGITLLAIAVAHLIVMLVPASGDAAGPSLKLKLTPNRNVAINEAQCFRGTVRGPSGNPVKGALVTLEGKRAKSKRGGKVKVCKTLRWPGRHAAVVTKGKHHGFGFIRARSTGAGLNGDWTRIDIQLPAYPRDDAPTGSCGDGTASFDQPDFAEIGGYCKGTANPGSDGPFSGKSVVVTWTTTRVGERVIPLIFRVSAESTRTELNGYMTSEAARVYFVQIATLGDKYYSAGSDPAKPGDKGGPFLIQPSRHSDFFGSDDGYTFHAIGWVFG